MMSPVRRLSTFLLICVIGVAFARSSSTVQKHRIAIQGRGERALTTIRALRPSPKKVSMSPSVVPVDKYPKKSLKPLKKSCKKSYKKSPKMSKYGTKYPESKYSASKYPKSKKGAQPTVDCFQGSSVGLV